MTLLLCLAGGLSTPALAEPPPPLSLDRFIEIDRRQRRLYGVAATGAALGVGVEVVGMVTAQPPLYEVGGTMEASAGAVMTYSALRSGFALRRLDAGPVPWLGLLGGVAFATDLGATTVAISNPDLRTKQRAAGAAVTARAVTYTAAILQQVVNQSGRRKLDLRTRKPRRRRHVRLQVSPTVSADRLGLALHLDGT